MKILVINSSPRMDKGNTARILNPFVEGMKEAGAEVETLYPRKMKILPCEGCFDCWVKTPGVCRHKDDMSAVIPKIGGADVWVLATPLYVDGMTGTMKMLLDRFIPNIQPFFELRDGHNRHPGREGTRTGGKIVLVSTCGFWEMDNFDALVFHIKSLCRNANREFAGALLRPHAGSLDALVKAGFAVDVIEAAKSAGKQLVTTGKIAPETLTTVSRQLLPMEIYMDAANRGFQQMLDARVGK
jgi:multimeric flavodoxin WrbA